MSEEVKHLLTWQRDMDTKSEECEVSYYKAVMLYRLHSHYTLAAFDDEASRLPAAYQKLFNGDVAVNGWFKDLQGNLCVQIRVWGSMRRQMQEKRLAGLNMRLSPRLMLKSEVKRDSFGIIEPSGRVNLLDVEIEGVVATPRS